MGYLMAQPLFITPKTAAHIGFPLTFPFIKPMVFYLCSVAFAFICGAVGGALLYRNNAAKLQAKESEGRKLLEALKGK